jgi:hypothetical protein
VINYSKDYLEYAIGLRSDQRFGLEIPTGINMQSLLDIYNVSVNLKLDSLSTATELMINNYYGKLYSRK